MPSATTKNWKNAERCRICGNPNLTEVLGLGEQYLASSFVKTNIGNPLAESTFPLTLMLCDKRANARACGLVQLRETVQRDLLYRDYFYRSATNPMMRDALRELVDETLQHVKSEKGDRVLDIGCNDGTMLGYFPGTLDRFGIDPAENVPRAQLDPSIRIVTDYFSKATARRLAGDGLFKVVTSVAMFYDLDDPHAFVRDAKSILHPEGVWCIQVSYLRDLILNLNFYDICHEHLLYYSLRALVALMEAHDLSVVDASTNPVNGGSLRIFVKHRKPGTAPSPAVTRLLAEEDALGLERAETFEVFKKRVDDLKCEVVAFASREKEAGRLVIGLGASTKGNVLLQYFGMGKNLIPYIADRNPEKVGLRTLGTDIEIISEERAHELRPSSMLVLIWFFKDELLRREAEYLAAGGKLLFPMPSLHVVTKDG